MIRKVYKGQTVFGFLSLINDGYAVEESFRFEGVEVGSKRLSLLPCGSEGGVGFQFVVSFLILVKSGSEVFGGLVAASEIGHRYRSANSWWRWRELLVGLTGLVSS